MKTVKMTYALTCAAAVCCCITSCDTSRDVSGVIESVGSGTAGGVGGSGWTGGTEYRYIKLVGDPHMYICETQRSPACGALVKGQRISATVDSYDYIYSLSLTG